MLSKPFCLSTGEGGGRSLYDVTSYLAVWSLTLVPCSFWGSLPRGVSVQRGLCPGASLSRGSLSRRSLSRVSLSRGSLTKGSFVQGDPQGPLGTVKSILLECIRVTSIFSILMEMEC